MRKTGTVGSASSREPQDWHAIDWHRVEQFVRTTQQRIAKATLEKDWRRVKALQRSLNHSFSARALAVRRVTENQGKRTAGVDRQLWETPALKRAAIGRLKQQRGYRPLPLRRVYIPKANGKERPLGIPTMFDRAMQALHLLGLEPVAETTSDPNSYGFRRNRSTAERHGPNICLHIPKGCGPVDIGGGYSRLFRSHQPRLAGPPITDRRRYAARWNHFANTGEYVFERAGNGLDPYLRERFGTKKGREAKNPCGSVRRRFRDYGQLARAAGARNQAVDRSIPCTKRGIHSPIKLLKLADTEIVRHEKIKGDFNPFDPSWEAYGEQLRTKRMRKRIAYQFETTQLYVSQAGRCALCTEPLDYDSGWHDHHLVYKVHGGSDALSNRVLPDPVCHVRLHALGLQVAKPAS
ncbi:hypothetical protein FQA39_LY19369 [Lamprigera yunnana]|nr:hypothetical protein FQA39_LY19369 [Lamprigera yunnana]